MRKTWVIGWAVLGLVLAGCDAKVDDAALKTGSKGNTRFEDFAAVKKLMDRKVFNKHPFTLYCEAKLMKRRKVNLPDGFAKSVEFFDRNFRYEFEHVVPAENLGRSFAEWREGSPKCVDDYGASFKGRSCAETNREYRLMSCDMYNLYPAIGSVNAERGNKNFALLDDIEDSTFGSCDMKIVGRKVEPPESARGVIARTYLYMEQAYAPRYRMSVSQRKLMEAWSKEYPVEKWECERAKTIERLQGNENPIVKEQCKNADLL